QTGFDPQSALYNRSVQQLQDQLNSVNAQNGVFGTPYGAGLVGQGLGNLNIDWQNAQLQRQLQALQGAGRGFAGASDLGGSAINTLATTGALPYSTYLGQQNDIVNAMNSVSGGYNNALGLDQNPLNALAAYLKLGQSATSVGQAGAAQNFGNNQSIGQGIGTALSQLSSNPGLSQLFAPTPNYSGFDFNAAQGTDYGSFSNFGAGGLDNASAGALF